MRVPFSSLEGPPRMPRLAGACDSHMHIFDDRYPMVAGAAAAPDARVADYRQLQNALGLTRAVVVAPSHYGSDNRCTLDATRELGPDGRCVVTLMPDTPADEILAMHAAGARGFRFNLTRSAMNRLDSLQVIAERVAGLGWHLQLWMHPDGLPGIAADLLALPVPVVLDHLAGLPLHGGRHHPAFESVQRLLASGRVWLKLSLATAWPQLLSNRGELDALAGSLVRQAPERMVWGSDWPHVVSLREGRGYPDDTLKLEALLDWISDDNDLQRILVNNPVRLYGFDA